MSDENIKDLSKEFVGRVRKHISSTADTAPDETVERFISGVVAAGGVVLMFWPGKGRESLALALLTTAARHYAKPSKEPAVRVVR